MKRQLLLFFFLLPILAAQAQELSVCTYNVRYKNSDDNNAGNGWTARRNYLINLINFQQPMPTSAWGAMTARRAASTPPSSIEKTAWCSSTKATSG